MKLDSSIFDSIRVKPGARAKVRDDQPRCQWEGCEHTGIYKAPMGRGREGRFFLFCIDHVREYNKSYNYFSGMTDDAIAKYQKDAMTGHRPTWKMSVNGRRGAETEAAETGTGWQAPPQDPFGLFGEKSGARQPAEGPPERRIRTLEKKAFDTLDMDATSDAERIKMRYKELVKRHHPDANGGDRSSEERLRQIIHAYKVLKQAGFC